MPRLLRRFKPLLTLTLALTLLSPASRAAAQALAPAPTAPAQADAPARTGAITGQVLDRDTRQPIAQASVAIEGTKLGALTDDAGRFTLRTVPVGSHRVRGWRLDYPGVLISDVVVTPGRTTQVVVELASEAVKQTEVEVKASGFAKPADQKTSSYQMNYEEIRRSPGALGDVFRLVQSLPGVINTNDQRNDIVARGGSPSENLILVDGIEVPYVNHFAAQGTAGGPVSMLNNELVRDADFQAGGMPAPFGGRLSSVMDIRLREGDRERFRSATDVTAAGYGTLLEGPLFKRGAWLLSARNSFYDLVAKPFGISSIPYTTNGQLKLSYDLTTHDKLWLDNVSGHDWIHFKFRPQDRDDPYTQDVATGGWRTVTGAAWQHLFGTRGYGTLTASDAFSRFENESHDPYRGGALVFHNASDEGESTVQYDAQLRAGAIGAFKAGVQYKNFRNTFDVSQPQGLENPFSTDSTRVDAIAFRLRTNDHAEAAYVQWSRALASHGELTLGARGQHFAALGKSAFDPRAGLTLHVRPALDLNLSYGRYHQQPALAYLAAYPVNRDLEPLQADHYVAGLAYTPAADLKLTLEVYTKRYADYPVARDYREFSLANSGDVYGLQGLLFPMVSAGTGRARGIEFYAQKKLTQGLYGQISYSYSRSEHRALDGVLRRGGFDIPHTGTFIVGYKKGAHWEFSTRGSFATGKPYTPAMQPQSAEQQRYILDLTRLNAARAPAYSRVDLRADRRFSIGSRNVTWWLEAENLFDRANAFTYLWNAKTNTLGTVKQIRFLPVMGFKVEL